ncbi:MAG TPA: rod shape-determining protein MreC [Gallionellaceae bacterium]
MDHTSSVKFFNRGPSPIVRLVFFSLLSLLLLFVDSRHQYLESTRSVLSTLIYPLQKLTTLPPMLWHETNEFFTTRNRLARENEELRAQHATDAAQTMQLQGLQAENLQLRAMLDMRERLKLPMQLAEVLYSERDPSRHKLLLNLGQSKVAAGQAVLDNTGVVGQITRVWPLLSEVTLITDKDHEVPVQVLRNNLRVILFGSGNPNELELRYAPVTADLQDGDLLVTSGIDGTYPPGLPVAKISHIERDPAYPFARVQTVPITGVNNQRSLFVLASLEKLPPRPESALEAPVVKGKKTGKASR